MSNAKLLDLGGPPDMRLPDADAFMKAWAALRDRERLVLQAYTHFAARESERTGRPTPMCWPTDAEVASFLGRSLTTIRRSRAELAMVSPPFIALRYVPPFARLPDGSTSEHGRNVVMILATGDAAEARATRELADARAHLGQLELALVEAKARVSAREAELEAVRKGVGERAVANDDGSTHNAPSVGTPGCSLRKGRVLKRGGESLELESIRGVA